MRIKSITDIITNSSSETFVIKNEGKSNEEILKLLESIEDNASSGVGGQLEVRDSDFHEGLTILYIDWAKQKCIDWIIKNLFVLDIEPSGGVTRDPLTKRVLSIEGEDEAEKIWEEVYYFWHPEWWKEDLSKLSWEDGLKFLEEYNIINIMNNDKKYSNYNYSISPEDNFDIWIKENNEIKNKIICELGL